MTRTKGGFITKRNHKKLIKFNNGHRGAHSKLFKTANQQNMHSLKYSYQDRKKKKRNLRTLWIKQINNEAKKNSLTYNKVIKNLKIKKIEINKKLLSKLAIFDNACFKLIIKN